MGGPALDRRGALPVDPAEVSFSECAESRQQPSGRRGHPQAFEQQVIEAECKIEGWIAEPGVFGVDEDRASGPTRMFFGLTSPWTTVSLVRAVVSASSSSAASRSGCA